MFLNHKPATTAQTDWEENAWIADDADYTDDADFNKTVVRNVMEDGLEEGNLLIFKLTSLLRKEKLKIRKEKLKEWNLVLCLLYVRR